MMSMTASQVRLFSNPALAHRFHSAYESSRADARGTSVFTRSRDRALCLHWVKTSGALDLVTQRSFSVSLLPTRGPETETFTDISIPGKRQIARVSVTTLEHMCVFSTELPPLLLRWLTPSFPPNLTPCKNC